MHTNLPDEHWTALGTGSAHAVQGWTDVQEKKQPLGFLPPKPKKTAKKRKKK